MSQKKQKTFLAALPLIFLLTGCLQIPGLDRITELRLPPAGMNLARAAEPAPTSPEEALPVRPLHCVIEKGSAQFGKKWRDFSPSNFDVRQGERITITLAGLKFSDESMTIQVRYDEGGQKMVFCPLKDNISPNAKITCASIYALEDDLELGIKRTLDVPDAVRSGVLRCGFEKLPK